MDKRAAEWLKQADYDLDTAEFMAKGGRCFYAVFMCHLAIEKALKGLYEQTLHETPPKTHNLLLLLDKIGLRPDAHRGTFMTRLNEANVATRYPEDIDTLQDQYTRQITSQILTQTRETLEWIKKQF